MTDFHHFSSWIASDIDGFHPLSCFLSFLPLRAPLKRVSISSSFFPRNISKSLWVPKFCVFREIWVGPRLCVKEAANAVMFTVPPSGSIQHGGFRHRCPALSETRGKACGIETLSAQEEVLYCQGRRVLANTRRKCTSFGPYRTIEPVPILI